MRTTRTRSLTAALLALLMVLAACSSDTDVAEPEAEGEQELALDLEEEEEPAEEEAAEEEAAEEETTEEEPAAEFDLVAAIDNHVSTLPEGWGTVGDVEALKEALTVENTVLIDVREPGEYEEGFIPDALSIPVRTTGSTDVEVPTDTKAIVYCQSGWRASLTLPMYHVLGYTNVEGFPGSFGAWVEAGEAVAS